MTAVGGVRGKAKPLYRKRRPWPAMVLFAVLAVVAGFIWVKVMNTTDDVDAAVHCNNPGPAPSGATPPATPAPKLGTVLAHDALDKTAPAPAAQVQVRVYNASNTRNQASIVNAAVTAAGFGTAGDPANDPVYVAGDMKCRAQIRFGPNGVAGARTLSIVEPCAELVRDERQDSTVDLAVGTKYDEFKVNSSAKQVLQQLAAWAQKQPPAQGGQLSQPTGQPPVSADLINAARAVHC
ncbi:envelope integrity protein Cei [Kutzneria buriramensis]|uniref:LytR cell envelope-related transcriptional attenuator n=1 Tax=Kutzneria buriramensis TaxID=1045776 RepID=A0A3E0HZF6_9PSEU|nr:envelope integrity protein Cei [Kutzneria buriramensis]REH51854.1 LytR cell envelope-related transcriptional attenuator [Kutzneria buriramensis]